MSQTFEVDKKYVNACESVFRCVAATEKMAILEADKPSRTSVWAVGDQFSCIQRDPWSTWSEYHEPVVMKTKRHVGLWHGSIHVTQSKTVGAMENIGEIEVTVTDGKLTDVRIL